MVQRNLTRRSVLGSGIGMGASLAAPAVTAGCGRGSENEPLKFWQFYAPAPQEEPVAQRQSQWFLDLVDSWNAENDRQIEAVYVPGAAYLDAAKLPTAFAAGTGPDIFIISPGDFLRYANGGVLADLTPYLDQADIDDYFPDAIKSRTVDGKVYALPMEVEPLAMFYGVDAWEKAGLSEGDIPKTWDDLLAIGDTLRTTNRAGLVFETNPGYYQNFTWYPWMWQGDGDVLDADGQVVFDAEPVAQALEFWQTAIESGVAPRTLPASGDLVSAFGADQAGTWQSGIWQVAAFRANAPDFKYGVYPLPTPPGGTYSTDLGGWAFVANAQGRDPEAAARFCVYAVGSMREDSVQRVADWCAGAKTDIAPRKSVLELATSNGGYDDPIMKAFKDDIFPGGRSEPRYPPVIYKLVSDAIQACQLAGKDPRAEAETAAQGIRAYLETYEGATIL